MARKTIGNKDVAIYAMGDVRVRETKDFKGQFRPILSTLREADIRYCQLEQILSERGALSRCGRFAPFRVSPGYVAGLKYAGFDVISPNGNHSLDWGVDAFLDTMSILEENGIRALGVGRDINEARRPVILEKNGNSIAFLAYNSILYPGWAAGVEWAGVAPMRVHTLYEQVEFDQPGTPCRIHTFPYREDMVAMKEDVKRARLSADVVVVAIHFGLHFVRAKLAEYQPEVCHAAVDAGADVIIGTHPHILKAIEVYKGKVIFYSLGNFSFAPLKRDPSLPIVSPMGKDMMELYGLKRHSDDALSKFIYPDGEKTAIAKILVSDKNVKEVSFIPVVTDREQTPERVKPGGEGFNAVVNYIKDVTKEAGIDTEFRVVGDEVLVLT